jgi:hypothetical protein
MTLTAAYALCVDSGIAHFGRLIQSAASRAVGAGMNVPHGMVPTSPVDGDIWTLGAGIFAPINGSTKMILTA